MTYKFYTGIISNRDNKRSPDIKIHYNGLFEGSKFDGNNIGDGSNEYKKESFILDIRWLIESFLKDMRFLDDAYVEFKDNIKIINLILFQRKELILLFLAELNYIIGKKSKFHIIVVESLFKNKISNYIPNIEDYLTFSNAWSIESTIFSKISSEEEWFAYLFNRESTPNILSGGETTYPSLWNLLIKSKSSLEDIPKIVSISNSGEVNFSLTFTFERTDIYDIEWTIFFLKYITQDFNNNIQIQFENNIIAKWDYGCDGYGKWIFIKGKNDIYLSEESIISFDMR